MHALDSEDRLSRRIRGRNTLVAGCGTSIVVCMVAAFGYLGWANTLPPLEPDQRVLPSPNGFDACAAAVANLPAQPSTGTPWDSDLAALRKDMIRARPGLAALSAAVRLPYLSPPRDPNSVGSFAKYREATRQLSAAARLELADGRPGAAMERALDAIELGAKLGRGGPLFDSLVGSACISIGQSAAERCVSQLSVDESRAAGKRLDNIMAQLPEAAEVMEQERRHSLTWARSVLAGRSPIAISPANLGDPTTWIDRAKERTLLVVYPKSWGYSQVDRYGRAMVTELRKPYPKRTPPPPSPPVEDPVLGGWSMELTMIQFSFARTQASLRLLRSELALREHRLRHGAYPATLQQLIPGELAAAPVDPFSDQPLRYRRQGAGYVLYSVGPDLQDDGGLPIVSRGVSSSSKGDLVAGKLFTSRKASTSSPR
jgi:hypothetical protein